MIDERTRDFLARPIEGEWPYMWLDATYVEVREARRIVPVAVTIAVGVNADGRREVLGMAVGSSEAERDCLEFRVGQRVNDQAAMAFEKRSPKRMANRALSMPNSRGPIFHSFSERFQTRKRSSSAGSSEGKWPLARTARRSLAFCASMALVM